MLLEKRRVDAAMLWPPGADIPSELRELLKRRHVYIHQGKLLSGADSAPYIFDFYRLQGLVELWILRLLGCPDTAINPRALFRVTVQ